jgi:cytochrome c5
MKTKIIIIALLGIVFFSCSKKLVPPVVNTQTEQVEVLKETLPVEIASGKTLYENNCANCHKLFPKEKHDKEGWAVTVDRMAPKANITDEQKKLVYNYLTYGM